MATKAQLATARAITELVNSETREVIYAEMIRTWGQMITVAALLADGRIKTISADCADDLAVMLGDLRTLVEYETWQKPGRDITGFITTDKDGNITAESVVSVAGNLHFAPLTTPGTSDAEFYIGRAAVASRTGIASAVARLGFVARFGGTPSEDMDFSISGWHFGRGERSCGYRFAVRHATAH